MTDEPINLQWGKAGIWWSQDGTVLVVPLWLDARATMLLETTLRQLGFGGYGLLLKSAEKTSGPGGTSVEPGFLRLCSIDLLDDFTPSKLRADIEIAARDARVAGEKAQQQDDAKAAAFLEVLHGD
jgi:hypothetical protein